MVFYTCTSKQFVLLCQQCLDAYKQKNIFNSERMQHVYTMYMTKQFILNNVVRVSVEFSLNVVLN